MKHKLHTHQHIFHLGILFLLLATGFFAFTSLQGEPQRQFNIATTVAIAYFAWGLFHHLADRDLNWKIVVEYAGISIFGIVAIWFLITM